MTTEIWEPHFLAITEVCRAAILICEALPETNTVLELKSLLEIQRSIHEDMAEGKHFGTRRLEAVISLCQKTCKELESLKKE